MLNVPNVQFQWIPEEILVFVFSTEYADYATDSQALEHSARMFRENNNDDICIMKMSFDNSETLRKNVGILVSTSVCTLTACLV